MKAALVAAALAASLIACDATEQARLPPLADVATLEVVTANGAHFFILDDPIFNGLAISLVFGIFVSTILTLVVIPVLYYVLVSHGAARKPAPTEAMR